MSKNLFLDIHVLQTVPPSNINRDDTGSPKTAQYGGVTRTRVSSQSWKKAIRDYFLENGSSSNVGIRSKDWFKELCEMCKESNQNMNDTDVLEKVAGNLAEALIDNKKNNRANEVKKLNDNLIKKLQYDLLLFLSRRQAQKFVDEIMKNITDKKKLKNILSEEPSVDIALFGRMVADDPTLNEDASCQVAHAISTHAVRTEFDFFTAVDDLNKESSGAGMLGTVEFNSSTLYRYANVAIHEFNRQLDGRKDEVINSLKLLIKAFAESMPTGKVNTFANQTVPQVLMINLRTDRPVSLVSAFENPVKHRDGYVKESAERLFDELKKVEKFVDKPVLTLSVSLEDVQHGEDIKIENSMRELVEDFGNYLETAL